MNANSELRDKIVDVCQGNPGALSILVQLMAAPTVIDFLHAHGPRGPGLWILYKDECNQSLECLVDILAVRMSEWSVEPDPA